MNRQTEINLFDGAHWLRLLLMLLFYIAVYTVAKILVIFSMLVQWVIVLIAGTPNERLIDFTGQLNRFSYQALQFLTFNSDDKPFPFAEWPGGE